MMEGNDEMCSALTLCLVVVVISVGFDILYVQQNERPKIGSKQNIMQTETVNTEYSSVKPRKNARGTDWPLTGRSAQDLLAFIGPILSTLENCLNNCVPPSLSHQNGPPGRRSPLLRQPRLHRPPNPQPKPRAPPRKTHPRPHRHILLLARTMFRHQRSHPLRPRHLHDLHRRHIRPAETLALPLPHYEASTIAPRT